MRATRGLSPSCSAALLTLGMCLPVSPMTAQLPTGQVNEPMLKELYAQLLAQCDGFDGSLGPPVLNCQVRGGGVNGGTGTTFAFVEFRDETCSQTIARFNGMELYGRNLKISHPNGYVEPATPVKTFGVPDDLYKRFGLDSYAPPIPPIDTWPSPRAATPARPSPLVPLAPPHQIPFGCALPPTRYEAMRRQDRPPQQLADRKSRELYVGNLTMGAVNSAMLIELFTYPLQRLPLGEGAAGISCPVVEAKVDQSGKFAFVLFADDQLATMALAIFNKMELCGRPLCVDRPAGYQPDMSRPLPPGMLENGMPTGGTGAPPEKAARAASAVAALAFENGPVAAGGAIGAASSSAMGPKPSHKLKLQNLLGPDEIADDKEFAECIDDIKDECARFGTLVSCVFPRPPELHGYAEADVGSCFVHYELMSAAVRAQSDLDGRDFDSRKVIATFVHEESKEESKEEPQEEAKEEPKPPEPEA